MSEAPRRERAPFYVAAAALAAAHLWLVNYFVPLRAVFAKAPLEGDDYDLHIGQVFRVLEGLDGWGKSWVYDVQLLAGQPEGTILDSGSKGWELFTFALYRCGVDRAVAFNVFILLVMLAPPVLLFAAARAFDLGREAALFAAAMASALWFFDSHVHWLWFVGMVSWALASSLAPLTVALFHRLLTTGRARLAIPCTLCLGFGLLIHPYTFFAVAPSMLASYARAFRGLSRRGHAEVVGIGAAAVAINGYWLANTARDWHYILNSAFYAQAGPRFLVCDFLDVLCSGADSGVVGTRTGFRFLYLGLAIAGIVVLRRKNDARYLPLVVGVATLYFWAYVGGVLPGLKQTQPYRQVTPAIMMSIVPAAAFAEAVLRERRLRELSFGALALIGILGVSLVRHLVANDVLYFMPRAVPEPARLLDGSRSPLSKYGHLWQLDAPSHVHYGVPHEAYLEFGAKSVIDWLTENVPHDARILVEGAVLGERLAWRGPFEIIGGFVERNITHAYANYFRQYPEAPSEFELARYLHVFAVGWIVTNRPEFERYAGVVEHVATIGGRNIYRTREPVKRVLSGAGATRASENRIAVTGTDPQQSIVLSYHFHEALRCRPSCRVERIDVDIDRVGLIQIPAPHPAEFEVYNAYAK
jgi:hypothetical protein